MPNVNFYLKEPGGKDPSLIILQMKYNGNRFVYAFGEFVKPTEWNFNKQRVKNISATTKDGKHNLNDLLKNLEEETIAAYNTEIKNGLPARATLKKHLDDFRNKNIEQEKADEKKITLISFLENFIKKNYKKLRSNTIKKYGTLLYHLKKYNSRIDFNDIDLSFFYSFKEYLEKQNLMQNSIAKVIAVLKATMAESFDQELHENLKFRNRKFSVSYVDVEAVYLNDDEIKILYKHDFSGNKKLEQVRDTFVVGCLSGLRFGDYSSLRPENITTNRKGQKFVNVFNTEKTGEEVIIPLHEYAEAIYKKYNGFPKKMSVQKFNEYLKIVCNDAGFTAKGRLQKEPETPLYDLITSHTARRSFCTNHYLAGFPVIDLMKISGHRTEKAFLKYVKVTKQQSAERLAAHLNMRKMQAV